MTSFLARELQRQNPALAFQHIPSTHRICTHEHLHPVSPQICGDLLTEVQVMAREAQHHQRFQAERLENVFNQAQLAMDIMRSPRMILTSDFSYVEDVKFLEQFAIRYKQGIGLSDDAHRV